MIQNLRDYVAEGEDADKILASLGSRFLNFKADSRSIIHSQRYSWQSLGGYNNGYDAIFRHFTGNNMDREKFAFTVGSTEYILWTWRGDYLNLGAGAEIAILPTSIGNGTRSKPWHTVSVPKCYPAQSPIE